MSHPSEEEELEAPPVCEGTTDAEMNMDLERSLQKLRDFMPEECFKSAERVTDDSMKRNLTDQQHLNKFFIHLEKQFKPDKGTTQQSNREEKKSSCSSFSWSYKVKVFTVVTGETFGAHDVLLQKVKSYRWTTVTVETTRNVQESHVVVVFCPITSRVGSDVAAAMTHIPDSCGNKPVILVLLHHTRDVKYSTDGRRWSDMYNNVVSDVHVLFHETKHGLLTCPKNDQAVDQIRKELKKYS